MQGVNGKILKVDLSNQEYSVDEHGENFYRKYVGGRGFALYYMHRELEPGIDPLAAENMLVFATSIVVGAPGPAISRLIVCGKSPLTGGFGESEAGGFWAPELKKAGYDAIVVTGKAEQPVYLWIKDGQVEFRDAEQLWGKETGEVQDLIRDELDDKRVRVAQIGPGSENLVKYGNITNDLGHFNGRNGLGAVMGSKNLKAIAVKGSESVELADKEKVIEINKWTAKEGMKNPLAEALHDVGTLGSVRANDEAGALPTRNWNKGKFDGVDEIAGETWRDTIGKKGKGCFACPIRCKRVVEVDQDSIKVDPKYGGPEYETVGALGSTLEIKSREVIAKANELCNKYTLDTISTGMTIALAMECYENGLLSQEDCDGLELNFGNQDAVLTLIEKIAQREGIGDLLAEGSLRAAEEIGQGAEKYVHQVKGQEVAMHDPRVKTGVGLQYALADYGADHMKAAHDTFYTAEDTYGTKTTKALGIYEPVDPLSMGADKARLFMNLDIYWTLIDMLGACCFGYVPRGPVPLQMLVELVQAVTGLDISLRELMEAAERSIDMARVFNNKEGFTSEDDVLPERFFEDFNDGPLQGEGAIDRDDFYEAVKLRYEMMGWDPETGVPKRSKLVKLGIDWIVVK
ncbi:aldehyde ferredoxin oxidoreductase family protein [Fuchsiella alkaliacetigena]|uniref:aldehyde ferredoxin oxidoreductase family protein n=1 Tax=Fuchsiella alkaliacetigena TaxID=957042 RepID=UPI00200AD31F|nr:aldehyde ferredoxin oxidoreductase family protein [Fuchsiella alkaliacetigena]MCK8824208.1 aldehyde ferredoxin oxidoreductase family protein [Fuchsiella alkaliacetigena]